MKATKEECFRQLQEKLETEKRFGERFDLCHEYVRLACEKGWCTPTEKKHKPKMAISYLRRNAVDVAWLDSSEIHINPNYCTADDLISVLFRDELYWREYEKFQLFRAAMQKIGKSRGVCDRNYSATELMPVLGQTKKSKVMGYEKQFPFSSWEEIEALLSKHDTLRFNIKPNTISIEGLFGISNADKYTLIQDPKNWIKAKADFPQDAQKPSGSDTFLDERLYEASIRDHNAYLIWLGLMSMPNKGRLREWERSLDAMFSKRDWWEGIRNESYRTTANGCVGSYSGSVWYDFPEQGKKVHVFGTSPKGNAYYVSRDGDVLFEII